MISFYGISHLFQSQISPASKAAYRDYLGKLELQYGKLLVNTNESLKSKNTVVL